MANGREREPRSREGIGASREGIGEESSSRLRRSRIAASPLTHAGSARFFSRPALIPPLIPPAPATNPTSYANPACRTIPPATLIPPATQAITRVPGIAILVSRAPRERGCVLANHTNSVRYPVLKTGLFTFYSNYRNSQFLSICYKL